MVDFAIEKLQYPRFEKLPSRVKSWLRRCREAAKSGERGENKRKRGPGGGKTPSAELEYALFNWYVDMHTSNGGRIWPSTLRKSAEVIKTKLRGYAEKDGRPPPVLCAITPQWIWRFMRKHKIVWRKATIKYKVSRSKMERRSKRSWLQSHKLQFGLELLHGQERKAKLLGRFKIHLVFAACR